MHERDYMKLAFRLARRAFGKTSPNPMVGAVLVKNSRIIGTGWHHRAGLPHAEVEAIRNATEPTAGSTLYVTLEPCSTHGRTPPCTEAIKAAGIRKVVIGALDPNPAHGGRAVALLKKAGIVVEHGLMAEEDLCLNEAFRHWIVRRTPFVTVKAAMSLDGKIATPTGQSKWITGPQARAEGMRIRTAADAILVGVNTIIADDPSLTIRKPGFRQKRWRRIVLDPTGRIPSGARVLTDAASQDTVIVTSNKCRRTFDVLTLRAPLRDGKLDLKWLLRKLGSDDITHLLVEGGGATNAGFLMGGLAHRVTFFYAPIVIGGKDSPTSVGGQGLPELNQSLKLDNVTWRRLGSDLYMTGRVASK